MLKAFKMPFVKNGGKRSGRIEARGAGPGDCRAILKRFKAMLQEMDAVDMSALQPSELSELQRHGLLSKKEAQEMEAIRERYARNGRPLWDYARTVVRELPETERQKEMDEIKRLLERVGFRESHWMWHQ